MNQLRMTLLIGLLLTLIVGCQQQRIKQDAASDYATVRDRFMAQNSYSFHGQTKLLTDSSANANYVNFFGQKQNQDVFMQVKLSFPDQQNVNTLSLVSKNQRLFAKMHKDDAWKPVDGQDVSIQQEFANWHPEFNFAQMDELRSSIVEVGDKNRTDNTKQLKVTLDPVKLKAWLGDQMKQQVQAKTTSTFAAKLKGALRLSDGNWRHAPSGVHAQSGNAATTERKINEILRTMTIEAYYTITYNQMSMLPSSSEMTIRSAYNLDGKRVNEQSQIVTHLQNYGHSYTLPEPTP